MIAWLVGMVKTVVMAVVNFAVDFVRDTLIEGVVGVVLFNK